MSGPGKWALFVAIGTLASGCAGSGPLRTSARDAAKAPEDPVSRLIASADARLAGGQEQSRAGHLNRAREEFDRALDLYLNAPGGAYASPRVAEAYKRTLEAIQLSEFEALAVLATEATGKLIAGIPQRSASEVENTVRQMTVVEWRAAFEG